MATSLLGRCIIAAGRRAAGVPGGAAVCRERGGHRRAPFGAVVEEEQRLPAGELPRLNSSVVVGQSARRARRRRGPSAAGRGELG